MPRQARCVIPGLPLHIVQRGISRDRCFFADVDYQTYLRFLSEFSEEFDCPVHAYCLMTNHVHLLVTPSMADASARLMKKLGQCYVQYVNHNLRRTGTLWEGRFRSCMVNSDPYVLACYRYIELNPVRAGMIRAARDYRWSSYRFNAEGAPGALVRTHPAYEALGNDPAQRCKAYVEGASESPPDRSGERAAVP